MVQHKYKNSINKSRPLFSFCELLLLYLNVKRLQRRKCVLKKHSVLRPMSPSQWSSPSLAQLHVGVQDQVQAKTQQVGIPPRFRPTGYYCSDQPLVKGPEVPLCSLHMDFLSGTTQSSCCCPAERLRSIPGSKDRTHVQKYNRFLR